MLPIVTPAALLRIPRPFGHHDFIYEVKYDGFRALAYIDAHRCRLILVVAACCSSRGRISRPNSRILSAVTVRCSTARSARLGPDGRSRFNHLLFRRDWPYFPGFDLLWLDGRDLRRLPLIERKAILRRLVPNNDRVRYVEHIENCGVEFFRAACKMDIEGLGCRWRHGIYQIGGAYPPRADDISSPSAIFGC